MDNQPSFSVLIGIIPFLFFFLWLVLNHFISGQEAPKFSSRSTFLVLAVVVLGGVGLISMALNPGVPVPTSVATPQAEASPFVPLATP